MFLTAGLPLHGTFRRPFLLPAALAVLAANAFLPVGADVEAALEEVHPPLVRTFRILSADVEAHERSGPNDGALNARIWLIALRLAFCYSTWLHQNFQTAVEAYLLFDMCLCV